MKTNGIVKSTESCNVNKVEKQGKLGKLALLIYAIAFIILSLLLDRVPAEKLIFDIAFYRLILSLFAFGFTLAFALDDSKRHTTKEFKNK